jgi:hypothetical protein
MCVTLQKPTAIRCPPRWRTRRTYTDPLAAHPNLLATTSRRRRWRASNSFERCGDTLGQAREALAEAVLAGELGAALAQRCLLGAELVAAGSELLAAPG